MFGITYVDVCHVRHDNLHLLFCFWNVGYVRGVCVLECEIVSAFVVQMWFKLINFVAFQASLVGVIRIMPKKGPPQPTQPDLRKQREEITKQEGIVTMGESWWWWKELNGMEIEMRNWKGIYIYKL